MSPCCRSHFAFESVAQGNDGRFAADDFCVWFARRLVRIRQTHLGEVVQVCLRNSSFPIMIAMHCCRRLHFLQQFISTAVPQVAGLNPKVWCVGSLSAFPHALLPIGLLVCLQGARAARPLRPTINAHNPRHMVDGDVVERFLHLSTADKQELARRLGASRSVAHHQSFRSSMSNS